MKIGDILPLTDSDGRKSSSLTITVVLLFVYVVLAALHAFDLTGKNGSGSLTAIGTAFGASLPLYYKRREQRDAHALKFATIRQKGKGDGSDS